jgi:hypothetical protein
MNSELLFIENIIGAPCLNAPLPKNRDAAGGGRIFPNKYPYGSTKFVHHCEV